MGGAWGCSKTQQLTDVSDAVLCVGTFYTLVSCILIQRSRACGCDSPMHADAVPWDGSNFDRAYGFPERHLEGQKQRNNHGDGHRTFHMDMDSARKQSLKLRYTHGAFSRHFHTRMKMPQNGTSGFWMRMVPRCNNVCRWGMVNPSGDPFSHMGPVGIPTLGFTTHLLHPLLSAPPHHLPAHQRISACTAPY